MERRAQRYTVWLPVRIADLEEGVAISHNVSGRGMLLVTAATLEVGATVRVVVRIPPDGGKETEIHGHVVRVEPNKDDPDGIWPHQMAVEFDQPVAEVEDALRSLAASGMARLQR